MKDECKDTFKVVAIAIVKEDELDKEQHELTSLEKQLQKAKMLKQEENIRAMKNAKKYNSRR